MTFTQNSYGFWRQDDTEGFVYDEDYKSKQSTTVEMSWLRLGVFLSNFSTSVKRFSRWHVCDVGSGNGVFAEEASKVFGHVAEYDLSGSSITAEELYSTKWDLICLTDVLEHFSNIDDLFKIHFDWLLLSFPETPKVDSWEELKSWRHFKPGEHLWCLNSQGMIHYLEDHGYTVVNHTYTEDVIRKSDSPCNIATIVARKLG